jgi:hypothetical protein
MSLGLLCGIEKYVTRLKAGLKAMPLKRVAKPLS